MSFSTLRMSSASFSSHATPSFSSFLTLFNRSSHHLRIYHFKSSSFSTNASSLSSISHSSSSSSSPFSALTSFLSSFPSSTTLFSTLPRGFGRANKKEPSSSSSDAEDKNNQKQDNDNDKDNDKEKEKDNEKEKQDGKEKEKEKGDEKDKEKEKESDKDSEKKRDDNKFKSKKDEDKLPFGIPPDKMALAMKISTGLTFLLAVVLYASGGPGQEITYQEFRTDLLEKGLVARIVVQSQIKRADVYLKSHNSPTHWFMIGSIDSFERSLEETQHDMGVDPHDLVPIQYVAPSAITPILTFMLEMGVMVGAFYLLSRYFMGGMGGKGGKSSFLGFTKSPATKINPGEMTKVTFNDVAGLDEAKLEVMEFVKFLKSPEKFTKLGAKIPKGALLCGPPGTGKTLLAKAMAGEASVPFFSISGSDFLEMFVGVGPGRVRDLFAQARQSAPCIVFIDEIDAVGRARGRGQFGGNDERENTLNQLLVEMDGFSTSEGVVVLAGTNRKDILDKALLRPGRFDRQILIDKPDMNGRQQIFMVHLKPLKLSDAHSREEVARRLAALTPGFSGADIANLCNEAALIAARADKPFIELADFERASDRVLGGLERKSSVMSKSERELVAHHEAGHAVAAWFLEHADPLLKVTIVPRGNGALGFAQYLPKELSLYHEQQLLDMMCMALGGRAAEQIFFGRVSTGAADDLQKVTRIAQAQVSTYGMSTELGNVSYAQTDENQFTKPYSEHTAQKIDEEVRLRISTAYERTLALLTTHKTKVAELAKRLLDKENVNHDDLVSVLGARQFSDSYEDYLRANREKDDAAKKAKAEKEQAAAQQQTAPNNSADIPAAPQFT